ncbi:DEAD/DEAH box helicase [Nannocystis punicea]|uniref:DEAD/DEAH box helicase n=1 Tax=Nannocystis punicea TaxID=2995304 RepID=A0ABY7H7Z3_9BACT|nr:DEAD/DEAH box helicase [Nannocystis poenicansa]WAS95381.1 DEAD/DEAH box helicase [Nannocystis poenicansa]
MTEPRTHVVGARVLIRDEEWLVRGVRITAGGAAELHVVGLSPLVRDREAMFLDDLDAIETLRPEDTELVFDDTPHCRRGRLQLEALLRRSPPTDARLYLGHRGAMDLAEYQLEPAALALAQPRPRLLVADGVGLGKTVEVGVLLAELIRRGRGRRILVVTLRSVLAQFQAELWARFAIPLVRLDAGGLQRIHRSLPAGMNPLDRLDRVIVSIDTLKQDEKYRRDLEQCRWDVVVIDECQHVADRSAARGERSRRSRLAARLARTCDALVLTSATPHDGRPESFASLVDLLDPTAIADSYHYTRDDIARLYVRRFKKDVAHEVRGAFPERSLALHSIAAGPAEDAVFAALAAAEFRTVDGDDRGVLLRTLLLKAFLSSPAALRASLAERRGHPRVLADDPAAAHDRHILDDLDRLAAAVTPARFGKLQRLLELLRDLGDRRVVVFSERIDTLEQLAIFLPAALGLEPAAVGVFHGALDESSQEALVHAFAGERGPLQLLLASDAASEGLNLHYVCHHLIHFDLPWSLITLEQRNGRIDRFGQRHPPRLDYLLTVPGDARLRGDLRVLGRLVDKERAAHDNLGDVRWLMGLFDPTAEARRIAEGIAAGESCEKIVPDAVKDALPAARPAARAVRAEPLSLFTDDAFARKAFAELHRADPEVPLPDYDGSQALLRVVPSADLARRLELLPPEAQAAALRLSAEPRAVQRALAEARERGDGWPDRSLAWELHPVFDWLVERLLAGLPRQCAPVLRVTRGLPAQVAFVTQSIAVDGHGRPLVVDWSAVLFAAGGPPTIAPLQDMIHGTCFNEHAPSDMSMKTLLPLREPAVAAARRHVRQLCQARLRERAAALAPEQRRLEDWAARVRSTRSARQLLELDAELAARRRWLADSLAVSPVPHVRIAAVLIGPEGASA